MLPEIGQRTLSTARGAAERRAVLEAEDGKESAGAEGSQRCPAPAAGRPDPGRTASALAGDGWCLAALRLLGEVMAGVWPGGENWSPLLLQVRAVLGVHRAI